MRALTLVLSGALSLVKQILVWLPSVTSSKWGSGLHFWVILVRPAESSVFPFPGLSIFCVGSQTGAHPLPFAAWHENQDTWFTLSCQILATSLRHLSPPSAAYSSGRRAFLVSELPLLGESGNVNELTFTENSGGICDIRSVINYWEIWYRVAMLNT